MSDLVLLKDREPDIGFNFVAFFDDGSGATVMLRYEGGYLDCEGEDTSLKHYASWIRLPDDFEMYFQKHDD